MVSKQSLGAKALARLEASGDGERARSLERWHWRAASAASASLLLRIAVTLRMLRVTVEEISPGNPQKKRVVRVMEISGGTELSEQMIFTPWRSGKVRLCVARALYVAAGRAFVGDPGNLSREPFALSS